MEKLFDDGSIQIWVNLMDGFEDDYVVVGDDDNPHLFYERQAYAKDGSEGLSVSEMTLSNVYGAREDILIAVFG